MRHNILLLVMLLVLSPAVSAQAYDEDPYDVEHFDENFSLNKPLDNGKSHHYTASGRIDFKPGFSYKPESGKHADFEVDPMGVFPPESGLTTAIPLSPNSNNYATVSSIDGFVDVGSLGEALYKVPIELPSGINGMEPNLAIVYNSQAGNGLLGYGWNLSGISSVTRTGSTLFHDGKMTAADFSNGDRFLLDGQRLIQCGTSGDTAIYKTEQDIFARILHYGTGGNSGFKVMYDDGTIAVFGGTADSKLMAQNSDNVIEWKISTLSDRNGNAVTYHYSNSRVTGEIDIDYIEYTSNTTAGISPEFKVEFVYHDGGRIDKHHYYIAGNIVQYNKLLEKIWINKGDSRICTYTFVYEHKGGYEINKGYNRMFCKLSKIWCKKGNRFAVPITIGRKFGNDNAVGKKVQKEAVFHGSTFPCNLNNDGFTDIIMVPYGNDETVKVFINKGGYFNETPDYTMERPENLVWIHVADMNGDDIDEIIFHTAKPRTNTNHYSHPKKSTLSVCRYSSSSGFVELKYITIKDYGAVVRIGDFLGNGKASCMIFKWKRQTSPTYEDWVEGEPILLYYDSFFYHDVTLNDIGTHSGNILADDFTGDGKTDLMVLDTDPPSTAKSLVYDVISLILPPPSSSSTYILLPIMDITQQTRQMDPIKTAYSGDMNGDGKADLIYQSSYLNYIDVLFSEGTCFSDRKTLGVVDYLIDFPYIELYDYDLSPMENRYGYSFLDIDSDGKSDFIVYGPDYATFYRDLTEARPHYCIDFEFGKINTINENEFFINSKDLTTGNFVKNGSVSFVCKRYNSTAPHYTYYTAYFHGVSETYLVSSIDNGFGGKLAFDYDFLMPDGSGFYSMTPKYLLYGMRTIALPMLALKNCKETYMGENGERYKSTSYQYTDAVYHKTGHGMMGFKKIVTCDSIDGEALMENHSYYQTSTMDFHAMLLPDRDTTFIFHDDKKICSKTNSYIFTSARCSQQSASHDGRLYIVRPAMKSRRTKTYNPDADGAFLAMNVTEYMYNYNSDHTYSNTYNCNVKQTYSGTDQNLNLQNCDFNAKTEYEFFDDNYSRWVINRVSQQTATSKFSDKPEITNKVRYEYSSVNPFLVSSMTAIPSSYDNDPLAVKTDYGYDAAGNVTRQTLSAPNAKRGETPKDVSYGYDSGKRLVKTKTIDPDGLKYSESYEYDEYDMVTSTTGASGLVTACQSDNPLGSTMTVTNPDGTKSVDALRWNVNNEFAPEGSSHYKWNKSTGGVTTWTFYHRTGVPLRTVVKDEHEKPTMVDMEYDAWGQLKRQSTPYRDESEAKWTVYEYDDLGRPTTVTAPDGTKTITSYDGFTTTTTVKTPDGNTHTTSQKTNSLGWVVESTDAEGATVTYDYYSDGKLKTATTSGGKVKLSVEYDHAGNRVTLDDPDYGKTTSKYNAYGQLLEQVSPKGKKTTYTYDELGRTETKTDVGEGKTTTYVYNEQESKGTLAKVIHNNETMEFTYDEFLRPISTKETIAGVSYVTTLEYDEASRVCKKIMPSGYELNYKFYITGRKHSVLDSEGRLLWHTDEVNSMGQLVKATTGNGAVISNTFDPETHRLTENYVSKNIQNFVYGYDKFGNLAARKDNINNVEETFTYDDIDRLTGVTLNGVLHSEIRYDNAGRMVMKQMDGRTVFNEASFSNAKPHAMVKATTARSVFPEDDQTIDYTSFDKVRRIVQGDNTITYTYGIDNQRVTMTEVAGGDRISKVYVGNCEFIKDNGVEKVRTYLTGPYGLFAVVEKAGGEEAIHYIYADHLGSWTTITDSVGNVEQRQSFDAWGRRRDPQTLSYDNVTVSFDRGYTMHEHYDAFGLINMNGRVYDPLVGRMLSPDILIQDPELSQAYNRYSYCLNNPLRFTDPSGYVTTIPPEFEKYYYPDLIGDYESYKEKLTEQGAENVSYNTESSEGKETTTLSWTVEGNKYQMEIVNHRLSGYGETCKNSCVADAFSAQEARFEYGNKELTPEEIMSWEENSCEHGLKASDIITLFLKQSEVYSNNGYTYTDMNDISGISYYEKRAYFEMDKNRGVFFNFSPSEFENGHVVNASTAIQFSIDNQVKAHEIRIWDSGNDNGKPGGYRSLLFYDLNKLFGKYGAFDK